MKKALRVGMIGSGEAGTCFAAHLVGAGVRVVVHDPVKAYLPAGVDRAVELDELSESDLVLSLVTPAAAEEVGAAFARIARPGQWYVDLNSTAPEPKVRVAELVGDGYVDGVMTGGGIKLDGPAIPVLLAGPGAGQAADLMVGLGFQARAVSDEVGVAASLKMLRSLIVKGFEGLWVEGLLAAERLGLREELLASVEDSLDRIPTRDFVTMLVTTHAGHARRRVVEVGHAVATASSAGVDAAAARGVLERFERSAALLDAGAHPAGEVPGSMGEALALLGGTS